MFDVMLKRSCLSSFDGSRLMVVNCPTRRVVFTVRVSSMRTRDDNGAPGDAGNVLPVPSKLASQVLTCLVAPTPYSRRTRCDQKSPPQKDVFQETDEEPVGSPGFDPFLNPSKHEGCDVDILLDNSGENEDDKEEGVSESYGTDDEVEWEPEDIEAISSLFQGRIPQKPGKLGRKRPSPMSLPYKNRPLGLPSPKNIPKPLSRQCVLNKFYKNPAFLIQLAKQIKDIPKEEDVSSVLNGYARFLRKGSLSMTIRELGHLGLPERALQVFCWALRLHQTLASSSSF